MRPIDYLLPYVLWAYLFVSFGLIAPFIFFTQGFLSYLYIACNIAPWAAILYYREELRIKKEQKPKNGFIGTNKWKKSIEELVDMLPKHKTDEEKPAETKK